jgi:hypothetical protein
MAGERLRAIMTAIPAIAAARRCKRTAILKSDRTFGDELNNRLIRGGPTINAPV